MPNSTPLPTQTPMATQMPMYVIAGSVEPCACCIGHPVHFEAVSEEGDVYLSARMQVHYNKAYSITVPAGTYTLIPSSDSSSLCKWNPPDRIVSAPSDAVDQDFYYTAH